MEVVLRSQMVNVWRTMSSAACGLVQECTDAGTFGHVAGGRLTIQINQRYELQDAAQAHRDLESRKTIGLSVFII